MQIITSKDNLNKNFFAEVGEYTQVKFVRLNQKVSGLLTGSDQGSITILPLDLYDRYIEQISVHQGAVNYLTLSPDHRLMFSAGQDGSIFIFRITEQIWNKKDGSLKPASMQIEDQPMDNKGNKDYRLKIVDPELADIVLVKKNEMTEWQVRQKQLKYDLALTKKKVEIKLKECKKRFEKQYQEIARQKDLDIRDLNKRFIDLQKQKQLQDRQNFEAMQKMEANHLQQVEEVQTLYEKKLYAQGSDYLSLEQSKLEMKKFYENKIADLKRQNRERIQTLLQEFKVNLNKVQDEYEETQRTGTNLRIYYEDKLKKLELEQEDEIAMLKLNHIDKKAELELKWKELEITQENEKKIKDEFERKKNEEKKEMMEAK